MRSNIKGLTLQEGLNAVIIVGLIGLIMGFFALFNDEFATTATRIPGSVTNESAYINVTGYTVAKVAAATGSNNFVAVQAINRTSGTQLIAAANYTLDSSTGILKNSSTNLINWANVSITYTYTVPSSAENITLGLNTEFENQTDILGLVLLAVFFGIAITALLASFLTRMFGNRV